jgi:PmbA protein
MEDLDTVAEQAAEMAVGAGAGDAEAYCVEETGRQVRVHAGEVESLTAATERGIGIRAWREGRVGYAYGTDLTEQGLREVAQAAAGAAGVADSDPFAAAPEPGAEPLEVEGLRDGSIASTPTQDVIALTIAVERAALDADERILGVEQAVYADGLRGLQRLRLSPGDGRRRGLA